MFGPIRSLALDYSSFYSDKLPIPEASSWIESLKKAGHFICFFSFEPISEFSSELCDLYVGSKTELLKKVGEDKLPLAFVSSNPDVLSQLGEPSPQDPWTRVAWLNKVTRGEEGAVHARSQRQAYQKLWDSFPENSSELRIDSLESLNRYFES